MPERLCPCTAYHPSAGVYLAFDEPFYCSEHCTVTVLDLLYGLSASCITISRVALWLVYCTPPGWCCLSGVKWGPCQIRYDRDPTHSVSNMSVVQQPAEQRALPAFHVLPAGHLLLMHTLLFHASYRCMPQLHASWWTGRFTLRAFST